MSNKRCRVLPPSSSSSEEDDDTHQMNPPSPRSLACLNLIDVDMREYTELAQYYETLLKRLNTNRLHLNLAWSASTKQLVVSSFENATACVTRRISSYTNNARIADNKLWNAVSASPMLPEFDTIIIPPEVWCEIILYSESPVAFRSISKHTRIIHDSHFSSFDLIKSYSAEVFGFPREFFSGPPDELQWELGFLMFGKAAANCNTPEPFLRQLLRYLCKNLSFSQGPLASNRWANGFLNPSNKVPGFMGALECMLRRSDCFGLCVSLMLGVYIDNKHPQLETDIASISLNAIYYKVTSGIDSRRLYYPIMTAVQFTLKERGCLLAIMLRHFALSTPNTCTGIEPLLCGLYTLPSVSPLLIETPLQDPLLLLSLYGFSHQKMNPLSIIGDEKLASILGATPIIDLMEYAIFHRLFDDDNFIFCPSPSPSPLRHHFANFFSYLQHRCSFPTASTIECRIGFGRHYRIPELPATVLKGVHHYVPFDRNTAAFYHTLMATTRLLKYAPTIWQSIVNVDWDASTRFPIQCSEYFIISQMSNGVDNWRNALAFSDITTLDALVSLLSRISMSHANMILSIRSIQEMIKKNNTTTEMLLEVAFPTTKKESEPTTKPATKKRGRKKKNIIVVPDN